MALLETRELSKSYDAVRALQSVSLSVESGSILGLIGENGAGKSTFAQCITGLIRPSSGQILLDGTPITGTTPEISGIPQEFNLVEDLTVAENIFLGREPVRFGLLDWNRMRLESRNWLTKLEADIDPDAMVASLSPASKQMVEVAKAFSHNCRILLMDEPTTILNHNETQRLFGIMREFRDQGNAIIYISHKLAEVKEICDRIAVLRDGVLVSIADSNQLDPEEMARRMVGRELTRMFPQPSNTALGETVLEVEHLVSKPAVQDISFELHRGELLGVAGLAGAGRTELAEAIAGLRKIDSGIIRLAGCERKFHTPVQAVSAGISYLPEDRQGTGILPDFSIEANITLVSLSRYCQGGVFHRKVARQVAGRYVKRFQIKPPDVSAPLSSLSGGNQQKVSIARGLDTNPTIFIFDEPTRGVDVGARREIYDFIRELADSGVACLMISSDMEELLGMCKKIMVVRDGCVAGFAEGNQLTETRLMYLAIGVKA